MSHEISEVVINGRNIVEAMYANSPAWHRLGNIFDAGGSRAPDSTEAARLSNLDSWSADLEPMFLADGAEVADNFAVVRSDTRATLSVVGSEYKTFQALEAFSFLDNLCQDGIMRYESAFAMRGGRTIALLARMPEVDTVAEGDTQLRYLLATTWHGGGAIVVKPTSVRTVCANTVALAMSEKSPSLSIRHSGDLDAKMSIASKWVAQLHAGFDQHIAGAQLLASRSYSDDQAREYIEALYPTPDAKASKRTKTAHTHKVDQVRKAWNSPANNLPSIKGTWWSLANMVTEAIDHGEPVRQSKDSTARAENKFASVMMGGAGDDFKAKAYATALAMSA